MPDKTRAALGLVAKLAATPDELTAADINVLRSAGLSDDAIEDCVAASVLFHIVDRLADAFGFFVPDDAGFEAGARVLLRMGYRLPAPVWRLAGA